MIHSLFTKEELDEIMPSSKTETQTETQYNLGILHHNLCQNLMFTSNYQMPIVNPIDCPIPKRIVAYYRTTTGKYQDYVPHFYTNDTNIELVWKNPYKFIERFTNKYSYVIGTDFSVYAELLFAQKIWNIFRNKLLVALWQYYGINVIPNISWINENYILSFEGWPKHSVIAVNSTGVGNSDRCKAMWIEGYNKMIEFLQPTHIIRYGAKIEGENEYISTYFPNDNLIFARYGR